MLNRVSKIPLVKDMSSQQGLVHTRNQNASWSHDSPSLEDKDAFMYFSKLDIPQITKAQWEDIYNNPPLIGSNLTNPPSFVESTEDILNEKITNTEVDGRFSIYSLVIGSFRVISTREGALVANFYRGCGKLSWGILENSARKKIEMQWQNISGMSAIVDENENEPGILEIEVNKPPAFFHLVTSPIPGKHGRWISSEDFTGGEASKFRTHYLQFPPGILEKHFNKLIQHRNQILKSSERPFQNWQQQTTLASQQQQPVVSTQVWQFGNTIPWSPNSISDSTSGDNHSNFVSSPLDTSINNQRPQETWSNYEKYSDFVN